MVVVVGAGLLVGVVVVGVGVRLVEVHAAISAAAEIDSAANTTRRENMTPDCATGPTSRQNRPLLTSRRPRPQSPLSEGDYSSACNTVWNRL